MSGLILFANLYSMKTWMLPSLDADIIWARITHHASPRSNITETKCKIYLATADIVGTDIMIPVETENHLKEVVQQSRYSDTIKATNPRPCPSSHSQLIRMDTHLVILLPAQSTSDTFNDTSWVRGTGDIHCLLSTNCHASQIVHSNNL